MSSSIIIPFRQSAPIPVCLTSLELCEGIEEHRLIFIQQGGNRFEFDRPDLDLQYFHAADDGPLNVARLHNAAVKAARTEWVTFVDPCLIVPPNFLTFIEHTMLAHGNRLVYFPIRHLDSEATELIGHRFNAFYERVIPSAGSWRLRCETYKGYPVGTDCFAVPRSQYIDLGGYDERYNSLDLGHIEFACRWLNEFGCPGRAECEVFHRWRRLEIRAGEGSDEVRARQHFWDREQAGFPPLEDELPWRR